MAQGKGIRIQKVLSDHGVMSRRKAEEAIRNGRITVNGHPAQLGNPVNPNRDIIAVDGKRIVFQRKKKNCLPIPARKKRSPWNFSVLQT